MAVWLTKIGSIQLGGQAFLAPMAKYTHLPFRLLCREYGAAMTTTHLVSCKSLLHQNPKAFDFIRTIPEESPVALQLFGNVPSEFARAVTDYGGDFDLIDINCGCCVPKAIAGEYGASLIKKPEKIGRIVSAVVGVTNQPVSVKTRVGWSMGDNTVQAIARLAENAGASAITLHARSVAQGFSGNADWNQIRFLKEKTGLMVIGNGDVKTSKDCLAMLERTKCDAVQIGRAAIGNAFLFTQCNDALAKKAVPERTRERIQIEFYRFLQLCQKYPVPLHEIRSNAMQMTKGLFGANHCRERLAQAHSIEAIHKTMAHLFAGSDRSSSPNNNP